MPKCMGFFTDDNLVTPKSYGVLESMGYLRYGLYESRLYSNVLPQVQNGQKYKGHEDG